MEERDFDQLTQDEFNRWLHQSTQRFRFRQLMPLARRPGGIKGNAAPESVFVLSAKGVNTGRDEGVYDFDRQNLLDKARFFADPGNGPLARVRSSGPSMLHTDIIECPLALVRSSGAAPGAVVPALYRPFVTKHYFADPTLSQRLTGKHYEIFGPDLQQPNQVINLCVNGKDFYALAADKLTDRHFAGNTHCLPLYRYTADGERVGNITDWAVREFNDHARDCWRENFAEWAGPEGITAEDIFAYTYAVLHDPVYQYDYGNDLLREFPRLPFYRDFTYWRDLGQRLLALHLGFETAEPYPLERREQERSPAGGRVILKADKEKGLIRLDEQTTLAGVPESAWRYALGSRSALEWVLDQHKERKPKDPTIAARFHPYRFADYKEQVIDLLQRVCTVSVETVEIVGEMAYWIDGFLAVFDDRDEDEWMSLPRRKHNWHYGPAAQRQRAGA